MRILKWKTTKIRCLIWNNYRLTRSHFKALDLNSFQFANFVSQSARLSGDESNVKRFTAPACHEDIVVAGETDAKGSHPRLRVMWCASAYRDLEGLYNVSMMAVTQDRQDEAVAMTLSMTGASYENAMRFARRFLAELKVAP